MMIGDIIISFKEDMVRTKNWLIKAYLENTCKHDYKIESFNSSKLWLRCKKCGRLWVKNK
ncbi:hypothetical protein [Leuconostoc mesenteroides]|uniref:hypothetical protein n=1 Tax=Leuconostoc mesenteroides TaxID=1245 RepID=UPI0023621BAE|nr:hypothetical protein [Leuconostoc mesenteroides]